MIDAHGWRLLGLLLLVVVVSAVVLLAAWRVDRQRERLKEMATMREAMARVQVDIAAMRSRLRS